MKTAFSIPEENIVVIFHHSDRRRTLAAIADALPDMDEEMRSLAQQTSSKLHRMSDTDFEAFSFQMTQEE